VHLANQHWIKPVFGSLDVTPCTHGSYIKGCVIQREDTHKEAQSEPEQDFDWIIASWVKIKVDLVDNWGISKRPQVAFSLQGRQFIGANFL